MVDAIVIGGGIVGMSTAYHLVCAGVETVLIDRADAGRATDAGAGILAPETNTRDPEFWFHFAVDAAAYYPTLVEQLRQAQDGDTGYAQCGKLTVAVSEDERDAFETSQRLIFARQEQRGLPSQADLHAMSTDEAQALFPPLAPTFGAIYSRTAARVDGRMLTRALQTAAELKGLTIVRASVEQLVIDGGAVVGVRTAEDTVDAGVVAIAGGAWSPAFGAQLGVDIPIAPQRGQIIHLGLAGTDTSTWPIISAFHSHYMVPWDDERVVVGATRETGSGFKVQATAAGVREVLDEALRVAPGLAEGEMRDIRVGLRPYTSDTMPVLGTVPNIQQVFLATGHGPTGLTLGPYSGKLIADMMMGQEPETDISAFHISRFSSSSGTRPHAT